MDRGPWRATVRGVSESRTRLNEPGTAHGCSCTLSVSLFGSSHLASLSLWRLLSVRVRRSVAWETRSPGPSAHLLLDTHSQTWLPETEDRIEAHRDASYTPL